jgi:3-hydroxybutyrate dehydrogenase
VREFDVDVVHSPADMPKPAEIAAMVDLAAQRYKQVDILVNNADIQHVEAIETFPIAKWDAYWRSTCRRLSTLCAG